MTKLRKTYQLIDEINQQYWDVYRAPGIDGKPVEVHVPREHRTPGLIAKDLLRSGAILPEHPFRDEWIRTALMADAPVVRRAASVGWRDDGSFVGHRHVAKPDGLDVEIKPPAAAGAGSMANIKVVGDLGGWTACIKVAEYSTAMMTAICCTFAAPLLRLVNRPGFGIGLIGPSRGGKTTAQLKAASALGYGAANEMPALNGTTSGRLSKAIEFNDHMLPLNEVGSMSGDKRDVHSQLRDLSYLYAGGQDKMRHSNWSGATPATTGTFRGIALLSSEHSPDEWAARAGQTRDDGERARLITLPVIAPGASSIYDLLPIDKEGEAGAWTRNTFGLVNNVLPHQRGVAICEYIDLLVANRKWATKRAMYLIDHFEKIVAKPTMSLIEREIVANFAVLYAAAMIATRFEILPFDKTVLKNAIRRACNWAIAALPDDRRDLRQGLQQLHEHLAGAAILDADHLSSRKLELFRNADGFKKLHGDGMEYTVRATSFQSWFKTPAIARAVLEYLDDEGFLKHAHEKTNRRSNEWAQKQVFWPNGPRIRSVFIYLPKGLADLDLSA